MQLSKTRKCDQCTIATPFENIKLYPSKDAKSYISLCKECGEQFKKRASPRTGASSVKSVPAVKAAESKASQAKEQQQKAMQKEALVCLHCNYKFKADMDKAGVSYNLRCPYCGRKDELRMRNSLLP